MSTDWTLAMPSRDDVRFPMFFIHELKSPKPRIFIAEGNFVWPMNTFAGYSLFTEDELWAGRISDEENVFEYIRERFAECPAPPKGQAVFVCNVRDKMTGGVSEIWRADRRKEIRMDNYESLGILIDARRQVVASQKRCRSLASKLLRNDAQRTLGHAKEYLIKRGEM